LLKQKGIEVFSLEAICIAVYIANIYTSI